MSDLLFVAVLALVICPLLLWGFKNLPAERWQFLATVPLKKDESGTWKGVNLTYYGFFFATASGFATALVFVLLGSIGVPVRAIFILAVTLLAVCVPASSLIALVVEGKHYSFTVGGASFVGIVLCPWIILCMNHWMGDAGGYSSISVLSVLAAASISYAIGEGIGRLACISFGCCYGKALRDVHPLIRLIFKHTRFIFSGKTKKIAYAGGLVETEVVPVQGVTSVIDCCTGIAGVYLFLHGMYLNAFLLCLIVTQLWRFFSEFLRADYRGGRTISVYQILGLVGIIYSIFIAFIFPDAAVFKAQITIGLNILLNPFVFFFLQALWLAIFLYTGRSMVTGSSISFYVREDRI